MWFHQDDLTWMRLAQHSWGEQLLIPVNEHINYLFRLMFKLEYELFGWNYGEYFAVSLMLHLITMVLVGKITTIVTNNRTWGRWAAIIFAVNTNWNETVFWISGQTIQISAVLGLFTIWLILRQAKWPMILLAMVAASVTSALVVWLPLVTWAVWYRQRALSRVSVLVLVGIGLIYGKQGNLSVGESINWVTVAITGGLMVINTLIGRLWWPWEVGEMGRIGVTTGAIIGWGIVWGKKWAQWVKKNRQIIYLLVSLAAYYGIVAVGRAQYGIGIMRAERYAYLGLALFLPIAMWTLSQMKVKLQWVGGGAIIILMIQTAGLTDRMGRYVERPRQLKDLSQKIEQLDKTKCYRDDYFPNFVFGNETTTYSEYQSLWQGWKVGGTECSTMPK